MRHTTVVLLLVGMASGCARPPGRPAAPPPIPDCDADLVRRLGSDDISERDRAQLELRKLPLERLRVLESSGALDAETKARIQAAIGMHLESGLRESWAREEKALLQAIRGERRITVDLKAEPAWQALTKILDSSGVEAVLKGEKADLEDWKVTLQLKNALFWDAIESFCDKSAGVLISGRSRRPTLEFGLTGPKPPDDMEGRVRVLLEMGPLESSDAKETALPLTFIGMFPPGCRPLGAWIVDLEVGERMEVSRTEITSWSPELPKVGRDRVDDKLFNVGVLGKTLVKDKRLAKAAEITVSGNLLLQFPKEIRLARIDLEKARLPGYLKIIETDGLTFKFTSVPDSQDEIRVQFLHRDPPEGFELMRYVAHWEYADGKRAEIEPEDDDVDPEPDFHQAFRFKLAAGARSLSVQVWLGSDVEIIPFWIPDVPVPKR